MGLLTSMGILSLHVSLPICATCRNMGRKTYTMICWGLVFHCSVAGAHLHLDNLKGKDGEIGMRIGNGEYFGIINVGDSGTLAKKCEEVGLNVMSKEYTEKSLFANINKPDSSLNILIGSKKFTEGWSSWRVSTMGLLNVGKSEGSQIIQLFGRGVRLKGYKFSLKRSSALDASLQPESKPRFMYNLETLNIFGIKADYMEQFKQFLEDEGCRQMTLIGRSLICLFCPLPISEESD